MCLFPYRLCTPLVFATLLTLPLFGQTTVPDKNSFGPIELDGHLRRHVMTANSAQQVVNIQNLIANETYSFIVPEDPALGICRPEIKALDPAMQVIHYDQSARQLVFKTSGKTAQVELTYPCSWDTDNPPRHYVSIACETCLKKDLKSYTEAMGGVLEVTGGYSAEELIKDVLIGGNCFDVTGVTFEGNGGQIGRFSNGQTNIGFPSGVIMATGDISLAPGPNDADGASAGYGTSTPDGDLSQLTGGALFDKASIEFDFTPTQSPLTFSYVFASEEYCEYVGTQFNDVFGFFVSGPGVPGGQMNVALIPGTNTPVAINNVNHISYSGFYVNNQPASSANLCGQTAATGPAVNEIQYDGYTRKFTSVLAVQTCQTYHIKLKIADVGDGVWDSAVFLNEGSFDAGGNASVTWEVNGNPDLKEVHEGCGTVKLIFERVGGNMNVPVAVQYTVSGTATPNVDYSAIPPVVVIPAGQDKVELTINILNDAIIEGAETVIVKLNNACSCLNPQETLIILDLPKLVAVPDTVTICGPGVGTVNVTVPSGVPPYTYAWQNGSVDPTASLFVATSSNVKVTVTDACGKTTVATARIIVHPLPKAQLQPPAPQLCEGQDGKIKITFTGTGPFELVYMYNGQPQTPISDITDNPFFLTINDPGLYQIQSVTDAEGCQGTGQGALLVVPSTLTLTGVATNVQCASAANGSINTTVTGGQGPFNYTWTGPVNIGNLPDPINLPPGNYVVTVTDGFGCTDVQQFQIIAPNALTPSIVSAQGTNCANPNAGSINLDVTGGFPGYTYKWNNNSVVQDPQNLTAGTYTVTVTDQSGCSKTVTATVPGDFTPPLASATVNGQITCQTTSLTLNGSGSSVGPNFTYKWTAAPGNIQSGNTTLNPIVNQAGNYILTVTNSDNGCTATTSVSVSANNTLPLAEAGPAQTITCAVTNATLNGTGSSAGANFTYQWTAGPGGNIISGPTSLTPVVTTAGTYTILVTNTQSGCTKTDEVTVGLNNAAPTAAVAPPGTLTCTVSLVTLNGSASPAGGTYSYQWSTVNGNIQSGQASANATVTEEGDYTLVVTNTQNGCTDDATVHVNLDFTDPTAIVVVNNQITCKNATVTIDATASSNGAGYTYFWTTSGGGHIASGGNTLTPVVDAPGFYAIIVTNLFNNCTASASVQVTKNTTPPLVNPGQPGTLTCENTQIELGDPLTVVLPFITYQWTNSAGGNIVSGATTPSIIVDKPATYSLLVTNTQNGCTSTGSTQIAQNILPPAVVANTPGELNCVTPTLQLSGAGSSVGVNIEYNWTTLNGNIVAGAATLTPTITSAGTYTLTATDNANGCTASASVTVSLNVTPPAVAIAPPAVLTCNQPQIPLNATGSSAGPNFTYQWGTQNGSILSGGTTLQPVVGQGGTYMLIVTNTTNHCTAMQTVNVTADVAAPVASAGPTQTLNCQQTSLALNGSGSSQGPNFTYQWTTIVGGNLIPPTNIQTPLVDQPGIYQLLVTNIQNGCTSVATVEIKQDASDPVVQIAAPGVLNCKNAQVLLSSAGSSTGGNMTYTWSGPGLVSSPTSLNATVDQPGVYTLIITNTTNGCTSDMPVTVIQDIQPPVADASVFPAILNCYNPQLQVGSLNTSTGPNYTYNWMGLGIVSGGNQAQAIVNQPGLYTLVVTNTTNGCTATDDVTLTIDQTPPQAVAGPGSILTCVVNTYQLSPTVSQGPEYTYQWTTSTGSFVTPANIAAPTVNGAGTYFLVVTNTTNGCTATDQLNIGQSADFPKADAGTAGVLTCAVNTILLNGVGSSTGSQFTYQWTASNGGNIVGGGHTLTPTIDQPGTYTLAVLDNTNQCVSNSSVNVAQDITPPDIDAGTPQTLTCTLASLTLSGKVNNNGSFLYQWEAQNGGVIVSGTNTLTPVISAVGTYVLTVTNTLNGCSSTDSVDILADQNAPVVSIAAPATLTCAVKNVALDAAGSSTGNVQYAWTTVDGNFSNLSDPLNAMVDKPGTYELKITNLDNGCVTTASVTVPQDIVVPVADAGANPTLTCAITSLQLNGNGSSAGPQYFYTWTTPNGIIVAGDHSLTPTVTAVGGYALNVTNINNGCSATAQVQVLQDVQPPTVAVATAPVITCVVPEVTLNGSASSIGPNFVYAWTTVTGNLINGQNSVMAQANTAGWYTLTVLNTLNGCSKSLDVQVTQNTVPPTVEAGPPFTLTCAVEQVTLQGFASNGPQYSYVWTASAGGKIVSGEKSLAPTVNSAGVYTLLVTNSDNGCTKEDLANVFQEMNVPTDFAFDLKRPSCLDNDGQITFEQVTGGYGPYLYSIDNGQTFTSTIEYSKIVPGTYELWIQDLNGCEFHKKLLVPKAPDPGISVTPEFNIVLGDSVQLNAVLSPGYYLSLVDTVVWTPVEGLLFTGNDIFSLLKPYARPFRPMEYTVTVISKDGCEASDRVLIRVDDEPHIFIPNVFSPWDEDALNDVVYIFADGDQILRINSFQIFDRWGNMVFRDANFQPNDPHHGWNGYHHGKLMDPAVFVYYAEIELIDGRKLLYKGDITLLR